ncbi:MAG: hypothetical protein OEY85_04410 [Rhodospirillales bacterium]|nr:hypothetical protein [Rhodospirillales bacterium]
MAFPAYRHLFPSKRRALFARVVAWVLFFNILAAAVLPSMSSLEAGPLPDFSNQKNTIVICTPSGLRLVYLDSTGQPVPDKMAEDGFCPLCLPVFKTLTCMPSIPANTARNYIHFESVVPATPDRPMPLALSADSCPRAPPLLLI